MQGSFLISIVRITNNSVRYCSSWDCCGTLACKTAKNEESTDIFSDTGLDKKLEEHKIVRRVIYAELPPRVEYFLTEFGESLLPVVRLMEKWGDENKELVLDLLAVSND